MTDFRHLLAPGRIGALELRNRIVMAPMGEELGNADGTLSDTQAAYLEARAAGGVGLVQLGSVSVAWPQGCSNKVQTALSDDRFIPSMRAAADRVHRHGGAIGMQLTHAGKNGVQDVLNGYPMWVPSPPVDGTVDPLYGMVTEAEGAAMNEAYTAPTTKVHYRVMDHDDIATVVDQFASATVRAREAGLDAVELHAGHGYLIDAFLSPTVNHRDDEYGGSVENRSRFLVEVLREVRRRVGDDFTVWCRLNSTEVGIDGITLDDCLVTARLAAEAGADAIHVSAYHDPGIATGPTDSYGPHTPELLVDKARAVKAVVDIPVIAVGRIEPERADALIAEGAFDFVAMGRKLLADPELPRKLAEGRTDEVRPCAYHYRCIGNIFVRTGTRCVVNAQLGRETELATVAAPAARKVLVVGGGPAGLEAARVAASRGHAVVLAEAARHLGGRFSLAAATSTTNDDLLRWLIREVERVGVDVRLGTRVDEAFVAAEAPDDVIVATGAGWERPEVSGANGATVRTVDQLAGWLLGDEPLDAGHLVVVGGDLPGLGIAQRAHADGVAVTVVDESDVFAQELGLPGRWRTVHDLRAAGVTLLGGVRVVAFDDDGVLVANDAGKQLLPADLAVVTAVGAPDRQLADRLVAAGVTVTSIGDCSGTTYLDAAMRTAVEAAVAI